MFGTLPLKGKFMYNKGDDPRVNYKKLHKYEIIKIFYT